MKYHKTFSQAIAYKKYINAKQSEKRDLALSRVARYYFPEIERYKKQRQHDLKKYTSHKSYLQFKKTPRYEKFKAKTNARNKIIRKNTHPSYDELMDHFKPDTQTGTICKASYPNSGYIQTNYGQKTFLVHRLIMMKHIGGFIEEGMTINHKSGIKDQNNISNLEIVTQAENIQHSREMGLYGAKSYPKKRVIAKRVLELHKQGLTTTKIGEIVGLSQSGVSVICRGLPAYMRGTKWQEQD